MTKERGMPVKIRIETERCPETGRDIVLCSLPVAALQVCLCFTLHFCHLGDCHRLRWNISKPVLPRACCLFMPFQCSSRTRTFRKENVLQEKFSNVQMLGGRTVCFVAIPSSEFHWRQTTESAIRNFILMSTFICNQQVANVKSWCFPACAETVLVYDSSGKYYYFSKLYNFPHFPEVQKYVLLCGGHLHTPAKAWLCSRAWLTEGWTQQPCASLNNVRLPSFT